MPSGTDEFGMVPTAVHQSCAPEPHTRAAHQSRAQTRTRTWGAAAGWMAESAGESAPTPVFRG